jgi:hypothetical protein
MPSLFRPIFPILLLTFTLIKPTTSSFYPCPQPSIFWSQHNAFDTLEPWPKLFLLGEGNKFAENNPIFGGTTTWYEVMKKYSHRTLCRNSASQLIAFKLNYRSFGNGNPVTNGHSMELEQLLEENCQSMSTDTNTLKNEVAQRLHSLSSYFTLINSNNDGCVPFSSLDCNKNGIKDSCEFDDTSSFKFICERGNWMSSMFQNCKHNVNMTNYEVCNIILNGNGKDCNRNRILDSCEVISTSELPCESVNCLFSPHGERVNQICTECYSIDADRDGVPDECQDEEDFVKQQRKGGQEENVPFKRRPSDCNYNLIEDSLEIYISMETDSDKNGIPDSCQLGHWCDIEGCHDGSFDDFNTLVSKGKLASTAQFSHKTSCQNNKMCVPFSKGDEVGSCCRRTSSLNTKVICNEFVRRDYCVLVLGGTFNLDPYCSNISCKHPIGSCCRGNVSKLEVEGDSFCFQSVSLASCRKAFSSSYTFDLRGNCEYLCNPPENITGTCVLNSRCIDNIHKRDCDNIRGKYDYIPCSDRLDLKEERFGSCCRMDGTCQDLVSEYDCLSGGDSKFSTNPCKEEGYCNQNLRGFDEEEECCWNEERLDCYRTKSVCNGKTVKCKGNPFCRLISHFPSGCCLFGFNGDTDQIFNLTLRRESIALGNIDELYGNLKCMEAREDCSFFSGIPMNHTGCIKMPQCLSLREGEHASDFINIITGTNINSDDDDMRIVDGNLTLPIAETEGGKRNVTGPQTIQTAEQIVTIVSLASVVFFTIVIFLGGYCMILNRQEGGRNLFDTLLGY